MTMLPGRSQLFHRALPPSDPESWAALSPVRGLPQTVVMPNERNVLGGELEACGLDPITGFYRDGHCTCGPAQARHLVCVVVTLVINLSGSESVPANREDDVLTVGLTILAVGVIAARRR